MRLYHYKVLFEEGGYIVVDALSWSDAAIIAAGRRTSEGKHIRIVRIDRNDDGVWNQVAGKVTFTLTNALLEPSKDVTEGEGPK